MYLVKPNFSPSSSSAPRTQPRLKRKSCRVFRHFLSLTSLSTGVTVLWTLVRSIALRPSFTNISLATSACAGSRDSTGSSSYLAEVFVKPTRSSSASASMAGNGVIVVDWSKKTTSANYRGSSSFATFLIIGPTCFFLGILFAQFPYDFPLLWTSDAVDPLYLDQLETHLKFMHQSPPIISRILHIMVATGFLGFFVKLFRPSEANMLFDGSSLVLYLIGVGIYIANIVKGLRTISAGIWNEDGFARTVDGPLTGSVVLGREDSLKVLSASNTILALVLVGVLVLQAGQWYAERKDKEDTEKFEREQQEKKATGTGTASKKKQ
ncbi:ER membrane protein SH3-domain-containing protein [Xylariales sp. PMI_506]|nr:ER membrane protein SH3-domain-containing protein [Xylariales sp. PMI_506]